MQRRENLTSEIDNWLDIYLGESTYARQCLDSSDLADRLITRNYCSEPYTQYEQALCCPINKRRQKECLMVSCPHHDFCRLLRKERYI